MLTSFSFILHTCVTCETTKLAFCLLFGVAHCGFAFYFFHSVTAVHLFGWVRGVDLRAIDVNAKFDIYSRINNEHR